MYIMDLMHLRLRFSMRVLSFKDEMMGFLDFHCCLKGQRLKQELTNVWLAGQPVHSVNKLLSEGASHMISACSSFFLARSNASCTIINHALKLNIFPPATEWPLYNTRLRSKTYSDTEEYYLYKGEFLH